MSKKRKATKPAVNISNMGREDAREVSHTYKNIGKIVYFNT
jgi:hypothetical protein